MREQPRRRTPSWPREVIREARSLYLEQGLGPSEIVRRLNDRKAEWGLEAGPPLATVKEWVKGLRSTDAKDRSERWSMRKASVEQAKALIPIVALMRWQAGPVATAWPTEREAFWIERIQAIAPELALDRVLSWARTAARYEHDEERVKFVEAEIMYLGAGSMAPPSMAPLGLRPDSPLPAGYTVEQFGAKFEADRAAAIKAQLEHQRQTKEDAS